VKERIRLQLARLLRALLIANSRPLPALAGPCLVIAPHADDETLGCGALMAAHAAAGQPVHVAFVSDSASADWSGAATRSERAAVRREEALGALAELGLGPDHAEFLDAPDGELHRLSPETQAHLIARFASLLTRVRPAHVFLPLLGEGSTEHDAVVWLAREASARAGVAPVVWEYPVWAWWNALRLRRQLSRPAENYHLSAVRWLPAKRRALAHHASQLPHLPAVLIDAALASSELYFRRSSLLP
jgi:LmbE family N-acetylglucosaminyl deacetylase